ncbi:hypothetical protein EV368DRAFT_37519 [Lentinula lateritia]|uniref:Uncharacterized protein n=1 Tax=Lentinula aff. lateritia TaxID=2804960 RepID=A0ACC1UH16_9AGAR|nr:hypothetical protein F5876DRAFT_29219 [Lentinula aff. lateritia]KAJ3854082.1 hypothetical protein EV368DRAFT_37519 [Lentinula lateritia]
MPPMAFRGLVTKVGFMNKTATVTVTRMVAHKTTRKRIERTKKYLTHDPENQLQKDDIVIIRNCPPVSARKRFKLETVISSPETERAKMRARRAIEQAKTTSTTNVLPTSALRALLSEQL